MLFDIPHVTIDIIWQKNMFSAIFLVWFGLCFGFGPNPECPVQDGLNTAPNSPNRHKMSDIFREIDHKQTDKH